MSSALQAVLAANVRAHRAERRLSQEELSNRMRALGLPWHRATVAKIETGRRPVSAEELLGLSASLAAPLSDLLAHQGLVHLHEDGLALDGSALQEALRTDAPAWPERTVESMVDWELRFPIDEVVRHAARRLGRDAGSVTFRARELYERTLTQERDRRVAELGPSDDTETLRARRGHVMRGLLAELAEAFDAADRSHQLAVEDATRRAAKRAKHGGTK